MNYDWYKIFNLTEFQARALTSVEYEVILEDLGLKTILVTKGVKTSVYFDDVFLTVQLNEDNPFEFEDRAVYLDANNDVWVGVKVED